MNNYKKAFLVLSLTLSSTAFAEPFDGFYVGAGVGGVKMNTENAVKQSLTTPLFSVINTHALDIENNDKSWLGSLNLGYGKTFNQTLYLGLDAAAQFESIDMGFDTQYLDNSINTSTYLKGFNKLDNELALTFMPGFVIKQKTLIYGKIGPTWGHFDNRIESGYEINNGLLSSYGSLHEENKRYHTGLRLGAGIEHFVSDSFSVKLEYLNNNYFDVETLNAENTFTGPALNASQLAVSDKVHAYNNSIMLGINYHFN